tara:strand:- start:198 stop:1010 length:813 start_codon:yes stop_codon:yes gene_type:complete
MDTMLDSKEIILTNINTIFTEYNKVREGDNEKLSKLVNEVKELGDCNKRLLSEISEKDKLLLVNDRKMNDYESMINQIQEDAMKEKTEKERFDMLKKQDKEIHERDIEIQRLQKKVDMLEEKLLLLDEKSDVNDNIVEVRDEDTREGTLVQKMKNIQEKQQDESEEEVETEVVDNPEEVEEVENPDEEIETPVVENPDDKEEGIDDGEETEELSEEEEAEVEIITYYKKEYYLVVNEDPQGIYMIENGGLGNKVGEVKGGKKVFYKSSKK